MGIITLEVETRKRFPPQRREHNFRINGLRQTERQEFKSLMCAIKWVDSVRTVRAADTATAPAAPVEAEIPKEKNDLHAEESITEGKPETDDNTPYEFVSIEYSTWTPISEEDPTHLGLVTEVLNALESAARYRPYSNKPYPIFDDETGRTKLVWTLIN